MTTLARWVRRSRRLSPALLEELEREPPWIYPWRLGPGVSPDVHEWMVRVHETRREMIEGPVRQALAAAGPDATALDLACSEGWYSHRLLEWGAARVVGIDIRQSSIRRARLIAQELEVGPDRLSFEEQDVMTLRPAKLGTFDVVLNFGLIYHLEDPAGAMRIARSLTRSLCPIDTLLTLQERPLEFMGLTPDEDPSKSGAFASYVESDSDSNPLAASGGAMSLIPNAVAVEQMATVAGFDRIERVAPPPLAHPLYVTGHRGVFLARVDGGSR